MSLQPIVIYFERIDQIGVRYNRVCERRGGELSGVNQRAFVSDWFIGNIGRDEPAGPLSTWCAAVRALDSRP